MTHTESFKNGLWIHSPAVLAIPPDVCFYRTAPGRYAFSDATSPSDYLPASRGLEIAVGVALPAFSAAAGALTVNMRTQSAGGAGPSNGGDLILLTGSGVVVGPAGRRGYFNVTGSSAGLRTTMIGENAGGFSTGADCTFLGYNAGAALGVAANNTFVGSGAGAAATGTDNTAVGYNTGIAAALNQNTVLGSSLTVAGGSANVNVGFNTAVTGAGNVSVGSNSLVTGSSNVAVGNSVNLGGASNSTAVGLSTSAGSGSIALGYGASAGVGVAVMGSNGFPIGILYGGKGETNAAATAWAVSGTGGWTGGGGNSPGADLELRGGPGTGTGVGGHVLIRNSPYGAAGIVVNPPATHLDFNQYGLAAHTPSAALTLVGDVVPAAVPSEWTLTAAAHGAAPGCGILAATERMDVYYNLTRTVRWASGNIALQRAFRITAPTYDLIAGVGQTITTAATFYVDNAPQAAVGGTAITQSYGIYQAAGNSYFGGALNLNSAGGAAVSPVGEGRIRYNNGTSAFEVSISGAAYVALPTGAMAAPGGVNTNVQYNNAGAFGGSGAFTFTAASGTVTLTQPIVNGGTPNLLVATGGAHTALATTVECTDIYFNLNRTVTWASGNIALQRAFRISAPVYSIPVGVGQTITTAATFYVDGAPTSAGGGTVITNAYAAYLNGATYINGKLTVTGGVDPTYMELAGTVNDTYLNMTDGNGVPVSPGNQGRLRYLNGTGFQISVNGGAYATIATGAGSVPGGLDTYMQYNNAGAFGGTADLTYDDTGGNLWLTFNTGLRTKASADPGAWAAANDTDGTTVYARTQSGGQNTGASNPNGANFVFITGAKGALGAGRAGYFNVTNSAAGARTTYIGEDSGNLATGVDNVSLGYHAGYALTTGKWNVYIGSEAGAANALADENTFVGYQAGLACTGAGGGTNGQGNTGIGFWALQKCTTGRWNTGVGEAALGSLTDKYQCTAVGYAAAYNWVGTVGPQEFITAFGYAALEHCVSGVGNTGIGKEALHLTLGSYNTALGEVAGYVNTTGSNNTCIGYSAGARSGAGGTGTGSDNTFVGYLAGNGNSATMTVAQNVCVGSGAGKLCTSMADSVFIGYNAGDAITSGAQNVGVGTDALGAMTTASTAVAVGYQAGLVHTGGACVYIGCQAGRTMTTGTGNIHLGVDTVGSSTTASNEFVAGSSTFPVNNVHFGRGVYNDTSTDTKIHGTSAATGNNTGSAIYIVAGRGRGSGLGGDFYVQTSPTSAAAGTVQTPVTVFRISTSGRMVFTCPANDATKVIAASELISADFDLSATRIWTNGTIAKQRMVRFQSGNLQGTAPGTTFTDARTVCVCGAPGIGSNCTITNAWALYVNVGSFSTSGQLPGVFKINTANSVDDPNARGNIRAQTECTDVMFDLSGTTSWNTGNFATQRAFRVLAPTYAFNLASTITEARTFSLEGAPIAGANATLTDTWAAVILSGVHSAGKPHIIRFEGGAHTALVATECFDVSFKLDRTVQFTSNVGFALQRAINITAPTYAFAAATGTITTAATLYVENAPQVGANAAITNAYAFMVGAGKSRFDGGLLHPYNVLPYTEASSPVTVNSYDSNTVYTNASATGTLQMNLPSAVAGLEYTFIVYAAQTFRIWAAAGQYVRLAATLSGSSDLGTGNSKGYCDAATVGNVVKLVAVNTSEWVAVSIVGSWNVV